MVPCSAEDHLNIILQLKASQDFLWKLILRTFWRWSIVQEWGKQHRIFTRNGLLIKFHNKSWAAFGYKMNSMWFSAILVMILCHLPHSCTVCPIGKKTIQFKVSFPFVITATSGVIKQWIITSYDIQRTWHIKLFEMFITAVIR